MSEPFLAEVKMVGFNFPPRGFATCDGQILPINQNQALYSLLGTTYGGDGRTSFGLPDLRSRAPVGVGTGAGLGSVNLGEKSGVENATVSPAEMPAHDHPMNAHDAPGDYPIPLAGPSLAQYNNGYNANGGVPQSPDTLQHTGGDQSHSNMQPYTVISFVIALTGLFPSRN